MAGYNEILGHENIIKQLKNAISGDKVSHAYILNGEDGAGKNVLAMAFAKALLCEKGMAEACNECHFCKQVESGNNPDLIYVTHEKPNSIGVEDVREQLVEDIQIKPYNGRYKVYIVDEAEKMTVQAQNAILKTIEEPPAYSVILFLTNNSEIFLPTIISRCILFNLRPLRESEIMEYLIAKFRIPEYEAKICASYAQGKLGRGIKLASSEEFAQIKDEVIKLVNNVYSYDIADLIEAVKHVSDYKISVNEYIDLLQMWYRDVLLFKVTKDPNSLIFADEINGIRKQASRSSYEGLERILYGLDVAKARLKANVNFELTIELMLLTIKEN